MVGLSDKEEINYFVDINDNATTVPKDLIWDLNGIIAEEEIEGIISNAGKIIDKTSVIFNEIELNPLKDKLKIPSVRRKARFSYGGLCRTLLMITALKILTQIKKLEGGLLMTINQESL